jgi:hypothetical protein
MSFVEKIDGNSRDIKVTTTKSDQDGNKVTREFIISKEKRLNDLQTLIAHHVRELEVLPVLIQQSQEAINEANVEINAINALDEVLINEGAA